MLFVISYLKFSLIDKKMEHKLLSHEAKSVVSSPSPTTLQCIIRDIYYNYR